MQRPHRKPDTPQNGMPTWECPIPKWVELEVRRGWPGLCVQSGEVNDAGGVEGVLARAAGGEAGEQDSVLVAVVRGRVDRESEGVGRAAVAQAAEPDLLAIAENARDVGEGVAAGDLDPGVAAVVLAGRPPILTAAISRPWPS